MSSSSKTSGKFENPYREHSSYWAVCQSLVKLGTGKMHPAAEMLKTYPSIVGAEQWKAFKAKEARNEETGKDATARIIQNAIVTNRPDYGFPLRALGWEVRKDRNESGYLFGLYRCPPLRSPATPKAPSKSKTVKTAKKAAK